MTVLALPVQYRHHRKLILLPADVESFSRVSLSRIGRRRWRRPRPLLQRRTRNGHSATRATRTRRRRDSLFVRDRHGRDGRKKGRNGKGKKRRRQKMFLSAAAAFPHVTREPRHELPSFRSPGDVLGYYLFA